MPCKGRIFCWRDRRQLHFDFVTKIKVRLKSIQKVSFVVRKKVKSKESNQGKNLIDTRATISVYSSTSKIFLNI